MCQSARCGSWSRWRCDYRAEGLRVDPRRSQGNGGKGRVGVGSGLAARCREPEQRGGESRADVDELEMDISSRIYFIFSPFISSLYHNPE